MRKAFLGIDTSNYRTSCAVVDEDGKILYNHRELLKVPEGKRGLRQSEAFFQHVQRLPEVIEEAMEFRDSIVSVGVSTRPRPREGSYMPCFTAGTACAREIASALNVPLVEVSHQEGHVAAVKFFSEMRDDEDVIFYHFSGGTTEAILKDEIIGGTGDISFGQVLDRIGVRLGMQFPSGEEMDKIALKGGEYKPSLTPIKVRDGHLNLSGIETQAMRVLDHYEEEGKTEADGLIREVMDKITDSIILMSRLLAEANNINKFIFAGGVSSSGYIRQRIAEEFRGKYSYVFGSPVLSGDNACGVAILAGKGYLWP